MFECQNKTGTSDPEVLGWNLDGQCFADNSDRILPQQKTVQDLTIDKCMTACLEDHFIYAGVQAGGQCFCGNATPTSTAPQSACNRPCGGDTSQMCGGSWKMNIYQNRALAQPPAHTRFLETDRSVSTFSLRCREDGTFAFNQTTDQWPRCLQGGPLNCLDLLD